MNWLRPYVRQSSLDLRTQWQTSKRRLLDYLLVHIISGEGLFIVDNVRYQVKENTLVWIPPNTDHEMYGVSPSMQLGYIHFDLIYDPERSHWNAMIPGRVCDLSNYRELLHPEIPDDEVASWSGVLFSGNTPPQLTQLIHRIILTHRREGRHTLQLGAMLMEMIALISEEKKQPVEKIKQLQLFRKTAMRIAEATDQELNLKSLAKELKISTSHLRYLFHYYRNCSPRAYHQMVRISKGCELLSYTEMNVSEVADALGFGSIYSFSRAFKGIMNMSPSQFRNSGTLNRPQLSITTNLKGKTKMTDYENLKAAVIKGRRNDVTAAVQAAVNNGEDLNAIIEKALIPAMREIGDRFSRGEAFVPELLIAARAMQSGLKLIEPILVSSGRKHRGTVAIGTVYGDLHDIGKNLVSIMLKGADFEVIDLGVNCDIAKYDAGVAQGATIVACSALLTTTMPYMKEVVEHFRSTGVKVIIGGAAVSKEYCDEIGADGYSNDAYECVALVEKLIG